MTFPGSPIGYVGSVIITGALLAESAAVVDNKLNVTGGVVTRYAPGPDRIAQATLVVLIKPEPYERSASIDVTITPPDGEGQTVGFPVPESSLGGEIGFITLPLRIAVPTPGRYVCAVSTPSGSVDLPLNIIG